jgi:uncharacterized protein (DUF849 family)
MSGVPRSRRLKVERLAKANQQLKVERLAKANQQLFQKTADTLRNMRTRMVERGASEDELATFDHHCEQFLSGFKECERGT